MEIAIYLAGALCLIATILAGLFGALGHRDLLIWTSFGAVCSAFLTGFLWLQNYHWNKDARRNASDPSFSITSETSLTAARRAEGLGFWLRYEKIATGKSNLLRFLCPITDMMLIRVTNTGADPLIVAGYAVDMRCDNKGEWRRATIMDANSKLFYEGDAGLADASEVEMTKPILERVFVEKSIGPKDSVFGWVILERPDGCDQESEKLQWRFTITNINGLTATSVLVPSALQGHQDQNALRRAGFKIVHKHVNIEGDQRMFYSEVR